MADRLGVLLNRLEIDLPGDAPAPASLRTLGDRRRRRRRVAAVLVPVVLLALLGGWLLVPEPDPGSQPVIGPAPQGRLFNGELQGFNIGVAVTAQLPVGWSAAAHPAFNVDLRNADGTRGVAIMVYPSTPHQEFVSLRYAANAAAAALGTNGGPIPTWTQFAGRPAWQLDIAARPGAARSPKCLVYPRCQPLFAAMFYRSPALVGLLPHHPTALIFTKTPLDAVVWVWTTRPGDDLPATLAEVQPMFDTINFRLDHPQP
jgi:hypothetical protein